MMSSPKLTQTQSSEFDVIELVIRTWQGRNLIMLSVVTCLALALLWHITVPTRYTAQITVSAGAKWPYYEVEKFLDYFRASSSEEGTSQIENPINSKAMLNAFVDYFNERSALKAAIVEHHELFQEGQVQSDDLIRNIALGYQLLQNKNKEDYTLTFSTTNVDESNRILKSTYDLLQQSVRNDIHRILDVTKRTFLLDQDLKREKLLARIQKRTLELISERNRQVLHLQDQIDLARHLNISSGLLFTDRQVLILPTDELLELSAFPNYLQGYEVLEEQLRILKSSSTETLIEQDKKIHTLQQEQITLQTERLSSSFEAALRDLHVVKDDFMPINMNVADVSYTPQHNVVLLLAAAGLFGLTFGIILTLLYQAIRNRSNTRQDLVA